MKIIIKQDPPPCFKLSSTDSTAETVY